MIRSDLMNDPGLRERPPGEYAWDHTALGPTIYFRDTTGSKYELEDVQITYKLQIIHYFGYLSDLKTVLYLKDEIDGESRVIFAAEELPFDYITNFAVFESPDALPVDPVISIRTIGLPDHNKPSSGSLTIEDVGPARGT